MRKAEALKKASDLGYSIKYKHDGPFLTYYRKPGVPMTIYGQPTMFATVQKIGRSWYFEEHVESLT